MKYPVAEKFVSQQGEGVYTGTVMAFIRLTGCSVGKRICQHCDTAFEEIQPWLGGGLYTPAELREWVVALGNPEHICLTGGEPLDHQLDDLFEAFRAHTIHIETSGTRPIQRPVGYRNGWVCISPKPGFVEEYFEQADELKIIVPGLGVSTIIQLKSHPLSDSSNFRWPTLADAKRWAAQYNKPVFLQPRNGKFDVDRNYLALCEELVRTNPELRLSVQLHKLLRVR